MILALPLLVPALALGDPGLFNTARRLPQLDGSGYLRLAGDVDLDGDVDLVALTIDASTGFSWSGFRVLLNVGDLDFVDGAQDSFGFSPSPFSSLGVSYPRLADLTGDGLPELILDIQSAPTFDTFVYVNTGGGTFAPRQELGSWGTLQVVADREGDGAFEIVHFSAQGADTRIDWFGDDGTGTVVLESTDVLAGVSYGGIRPETLQLDGDADTDLVLSLPTEEILILRNNGGVLEIAQTLSTPGITSPNVVILAADFDNDGLDELLINKFVSSLSPPEFLAFENNGSDVFVPTTADLPNNFPFSNEDAAIVDWDGDGDLDVVSSSQTSPFLFENLGDFEFSFTNPITTEFGFVGVGPFDMTGDGIPDYVASRSIAIGDGTFTTGFGQDDVTVPPTTAPFYERVLDWEGDGDLDLLGSLGQLYRNDATGAFSQATFLLPPPPPGFSIGSALAYGDFDQDGFDDWLVQVFTGTTLAAVGIGYSDQKGGFLTPVAATPAFVNIPSNLKLWPVADIDSDGDGDLLISNAIWFNDGQGALTQSPTPYEGTPILVAELTGDSLLDVIASSSTVELVLWSQDSNGEFSPQDLNVTGSFNAVVDRIDLDGDGDLDLIATDSLRDIQLLENLGGSYAAPVLLTATSNLIPGAIAFSDFDADGVKDLWSMRTGTPGTDSNPKIEIWARRGGPFDFELDSSWVYLGYSSSGSNPNTQRFLDVDGDGDLDAVGRSLVRSLEFCGPDDGTIRQYGPAFAGAGGYKPVLGAQGPARVGSPSIELRLRQATGGAPLLLGLSASEALFEDFPVPGMTFLLGELATLIPFSTTGVSGDPGGGALTVPVNAMPAFAGVTFYHQAFIFDAGAPDGLASSNGLEIVYGL